MLLVDDHAVVRTGLRALVDADRDFQVVAEAGSLAEARAQLKTLEVDLVVLDLTLADGVGTDLLPLVRTLPRQPRVFVLTMHDEPAQIRRAIESGADGYATKESAGAELLQGCRAVMGGARYLHPALGVTLASPPPVELSPRERQVLRLLAEGYTNAEIAARLFVAVRTVEAHRANLRVRLGAGRRADLVAEARRRGLVS